MGNSRIKLTTDASYGLMKLWFSTAIRPNLTRVITKQMCEIDPPPWGKEC